MMFLARYSRNFGETFSCSKILRLTSLYESLMNNVSSGFRSLDCKYLIVFPETATGSGKTMVAGYSMFWSTQINFLRIESPAFDLSKMLYDAPK